MVRRKNRLLVSGIFLLFLFLASAHVSAGVNRWTSLGPRSEAVVNALAKDPSAPDTVYAATAGGGVFKSEDGGETWGSINAGLDELFVTALAVDPTASGTVYAATADAGVFKTADGGKTWRQAANGLGAEQLSTLAIDPVQPSRLYAGSESGRIFRTTNRGEAWTLAYRANQGVAAIAVSSNSTVYATIHSGALQSPDGGDHWLSLSPPGSQPGFYGVYEPIACDPSSPQTVYISFEGTPRKTTDGGATWSLPGSGIAGFVTTIALSPADPRKIVAGTANGTTYLSTDAAVTWRRLTGLSNDSHFIRALLLGGQPSPEVLAARGVTLLKGSTERDDLPWRSVTQGLDAATVATVAVNPLNSSTLLATDGVGLLRSDNAGESWSVADSDGATYFYNFTYSPGNRSTAFAGTDVGVLRTDDDGVSWQRTALEGALHTYTYGFAFHPTSPDIAYAATSVGVQKSTDSGRNWKLTAPGQPPAYAVLADRLNSSVLYATYYLYDSFSYVTYGQPVEKSVDGGATWKHADAGLPVSEGLSEPWVSVIAMDPVDPRTLYAGTLDRGVHKTTDGASSWNPANNGIENASVHALVVDPADPSILYVATDRGIYRSEDAAASWFPFNDGLTTLRVTALSIDSAGRHLYASTSGGGVFHALLGICDCFDLSVGMDDKTRLLRFDAATGRVALDALDEAGISLRTGPFGPYQGWTARRTSAGSDGLTRVLWTKVDGSAGLWLLGPKENQASYRFGPVAGWTAVDVAASVAGLTHILWSAADGRIAVWSIDNAGNVSTGPVYGPYPGSTAVAIAEGQDGLTRVLWNKLDGAAGLSFVGSEVLVLFGPVAGWTAVDAVVGADGQTRILWTHRDGRMALWRVDAAGRPTALGPTYTPPVGFIAGRVAAGPDGLIRVLWTDLKNAAILWLMSSDNVYLRSLTLDLFGATPSGGSIAGRGPEPSSPPTTSIAIPMRSPRWRVSSRSARPLSGSWTLEPYGFTNVTFRHAQGKHSRRGHHWGLVAPNLPPQSARFA